MAVSVRLDPVVRAKLTQQANLLGFTKSDFIKDALERVLGMKRVVTEPRPGAKVTSMHFGRQKINLRPESATQKQWFTGRQVAPGPLSPPPQPLGCPCRPPAPGGRGAG